MGYLLALFLLMPAFGQLPPKRLLPQRELGHILDVFIRDSHGKIRRKDLTDSGYVFETLKWVPDVGGVIGQCTSTLHTAPFKIEIEERYWGKASYVSKWALMYHELGHCACGRSHTMEEGEEWLVDHLEKWGFKVVHARRFPDGCPDSIMNYAVPSEKCVLVHRDEYLRELFKDCTHPLRLAYPYDVN